jgi:hypothetical protein
LHHIVPNVLDIGKDHLSKVCSFFEQPKKIHFLRSGPNIMLHAAPCMFILLREMK